MLYISNFGTKIIIASVIIFLLLLLITHLFLKSDAKRSNEGYSLIPLFALAAYLLFFFIPVTVGILFIDYIIRMTIDDPTKVVELNSTPHTVVIGILCGVIFFGSDADLLFFTA